MRPRHFSAFKSGRICSLSEALFSPVNSFNLSLTYLLQLRAGQTPLPLFLQLSPALLLANKSLGMFSAYGNVHRGSCDRVFKTIRTKSRLIYTVPENHCSVVINFFLCRG